MQQQLVEIPISKLKKFPGQPRKYFNPSKLQGLANSLQEEGQQVPGRVCEDPSSPGAYIIIAGERRWRALQEIYRRNPQTEPTFLAIVGENPNDSDKFVKALIDNLHREDLMPLEKAESYCRLQEEGFSVAKICRMINKSRLHVEDYCKLHRSSSKLKARLSPDTPEEQRIPPTAALTIVRSTSDHLLQDAMAREVALKRLKTYQVIDLVKEKTGNTQTRRELRPSEKRKSTVTFAERVAVEARQQIKRIKNTSLDKEEEKQVREHLEEILKSIQMILDALSKKT